MGGAMSDGSLSSESSLAVHFSDFYVYNQDTTDINDLKFSQKFDSLTNVKVFGRWKSPGSSTNNQLLIINLASVPGGQLVNSPTAQSPEPLAVMPENIRQVKLF
jgi:hypothetical protein